MKTTLALALFATLTLSAAPPVNYAGHWTYDSTASKGLPPQLAADVTVWTLAVKQTPERLNLQVHIENKRPEMPALDQSFDYTLDGKEAATKTSILTPRGPMEVPTTLKGHVNENGTVELSITRELSMGDETRQAVLTEKWDLSADGKTLTIHRHDVRPNGNTSDSDVVFHRAG
jgi:hypothetical protein